MDVAKGSAFEPMLTTAALAAREDFRLGNAIISPSTRTVTGPGGKADVEPRVMQVLVVLADAAGHVVTRDTLFSRCWGGAYVGDDSLNRAVGVVRKLASDIAAGSFEVETVPRTGYKLVVKSGTQPSTSANHGTTRRTLVAGAFATTAAVGIGWWLWLRDRPDPRFTTFMERGRGAIRLDESGAAKHFEQAVAVEPGNATAWGLLAYALGSGGTYGSQAMTGQTAAAVERAARAALRIDPKEPNALLAMTYLQSYGPIEREDEYRRILAIDPENTLVMRSLGQMMHGVGRCSEALAIVDRAITIEPLAPEHHFRKAMRLWVLGRTSEADRIIDRAMQYWPSHRLVRLARLMIYAFTGRVGAALALVDQEEAKPILLTPATISVWRASLAAFEDPSPSNVAAARKACVDGSKGSPAVAALAILTLSTIEEVDAAFDVANGFLLGRGSVIVRPASSPEVQPVKNAGWRNTFGLFTPPTKVMRLDPRFRALCDGLGLTDYWRRRGIGPDAFLFKA